MEKQCKGAFEKSKEVVYFYDYFTNPMDELLLIPLESARNTGESCSVCPEMNTHVQGEKKEEVRREPHVLSETQGNKKNYHQMQKQKTQEKKRHFFQSISHLWQRAFHEGNTHTTKEIDAMIAHFHRAILFLQEMKQEKLLGRRTEEL